jgi:hypothetical protein
MTRIDAPDVAQNFLLGLSFFGARRNGVYDGKCTIFVKP